MTLELLTSEQMKEADRLAIKSGISSLELMENAGLSVFQTLQQTYPKAQNILILCGPGNNGGDGFVVARHLKEIGLNVKVMLFGQPDMLQGDAAHMARKWETCGNENEINNTIEALTSANLQLSLNDDTFTIDLIIDAIFGTGLSRSIEGDMAKCIDFINMAKPHVLAIDVPSGLDATTGHILGTAIQADTTVTFFRRKIGHVLYPGRGLCWDIKVTDISIAEVVLKDIECNTKLNRPELWLNTYPWPTFNMHKYDRGYAIVVSGPAHATGASRLAAMAALRVGTGLVTVASPPEAVPIHACHLTSVMLHPIENTQALSCLLEDKRRNAVLIGPGTGIGAQTRAYVEACLNSGVHVVLDADALTSFAQDPDSLFAMIKSKPERNVVMTPHEGEFNRLFHEDSSLSEKLASLHTKSSKRERARHAAQRAGCIIALKGADTVIATPDGQAAINDNAPPWLATAGTGDVLAGLITGLLAQDMPAFDAVCAGVWLHGACANKLGMGMIAEDMPDALPRILNEDLSNYTSA
ncbi:MAG: NAD(P)H-hydrate dehydratase [Pseudomonadota bacterium]